MGALSRIWRHPGVFWLPCLILAGELAVAMGMALGFLTLISFIVALFLNLNYLLLASMQPKDFNVNSAYQCEPGQNYATIVTELSLLATLPWTSWGHDNLIGFF